MSAANSKFGEAELSERELQAAFTTSGGGDRESVGRLRAASSFGVIDEIDDDIKQTVVRNDEVAAYFKALQTTHITDNIRITRTGWFYIMLMLFLLPSAWSVFTIVTSAEFPPKLFYDYCQNTSFPDRQYSLVDCVMCCNNRSFVYRDLAIIPEDTRRWQIAAIVYSIFIAVISGPVYARLVLGEYIAMHLLCWGIVIKSTISVWQLLPVFVFGFLFSGVAVLNVIANSKLTEAFKNIPLGFGDHCAKDFAPLAYQVLIARFNDDNPSIQAAVPTNPLQLVKGFAIIFLPFVPLLLKIHVAASTTFSKLSLNDLVKDNQKSSTTFEHIRYEVEEDDCMKGIAQIAELYGEQEKTLTAMARHVLLCTWNWRHPVAESFGLAWGKDTIDVQRLCMKLRENGTLHAYQKRVKMVLNKKGVVMADSISTADSIRPPAAAAAPVAVATTPTGTKPLMGSTDGDSL